MEAVFLKLVNMSITASYLVLAVIALRLVFRKAPKWIFCVLWGLVALRLICPFSLESVLSLIPAAEPLPSNIIYTAHPEIQSGVAVIDKAVNPLLESSLTPVSPAVSANPTQILSFLLSRIWAIGAAGMLLYALVSFLLIYRRVATAIPVEKNIKRSEFIDTPFVLGLVRPVIYLPACMVSEDTPYVIAHEQAHIRRRDHWWKPLGFALLSVYWFNPAMWVAYILLCRDIEAACDEKVIREMAQEGRRAYSTALLNCSISRRRIAACPLAFGEVGVKDRVKRVMNYKKPAFWVVLAAVVLGIVMAVCFLTNPKEDLRFSAGNVTPRGLTLECKPKSALENLVFDGDFRLEVKGEDGTWEQVEPIGALVPVALDGAHLAGDIVIHPTNMRGVESLGMLCSGKELGLTEADYPGAEVYGIMLLQGEHPLGQSIQEAVGLDDLVFDIELTPNRADCQSIIGICREAAAALGQKFREPEIKEIKGAGNSADYASVEVLDTDLCPRYIARAVTDINIAPSPAWLQKRLRSVGLRPINNIVDITNYVMVEYGHPMHAFDLSCITDGHIIVRRGKEGEKVVTLDGKEREVSPDVLLIADPIKGVGIAGVMGGENSEITENTKTVLFEAAAFKGSNIRHTTRELRHVTDAAARFIKGVEPVNAMDAINRAIELVDELGAGKVIGESIDVCAVDTKERVINVDWKHVNAILNTAIAPEEMVKMLDTINIPAKVSGEKLVVTVPHYRVDIESSIESDWDIAEEIGRIYGYYNIEPTLMKGDTFRGP